MTAAEVIQKIEAVTGHQAKPTGDSSWSARCPAHEDGRESLSVTEGQDGRTLLKCHAGCSFVDIVAAVDLKPGDLFADNGRRTGHRHQSRIVATYDYTDEDGKLKFQVCRFEPKTFRQRRPDGNGGWTWSMRGVERVLYRLPSVLAIARAGGVVYLCEGEKDADRLAALGVCSTTAPQGAGKWRDTFTDSLRGAQVVVLPDNDDPGRQHAETVAKALHAAGIAVRVLELPSLPPKGDVSDWLAAGGDREKLEALADECPAWQPSAVTVEADDRPALSNVYRDADGLEGRPIKQISADVFEATGGWPKCAGGVLFVDEGRDAPRWLTEPRDLQAWLGEGFRLHWTRGGRTESAVPLDVFHAHLRHHAERFGTVEAAPHFPRVPGAYYLKAADVGQGDGAALTELLSYIDNTDTRADKALLRALFLTPGWGGPCGARPAFVITAPDRGCGKTTVGEAVAAVWGGAVAVDPDGHGADRLTQRLLDTEAAQRRVVLCDNIKGRGSASIEALVTAQTISGHRLYAGEASRPNRLTWVLTANSPRLTADLAARAFILRLEKPTYRGGWRERLLAFIEKHRRRIQSDALALLAGERARHGATDRFQSWLDDVLATAAPFPDVVREVIETNNARRDEGDEEAGEAELLLDAIRARGDCFLPAGAVRDLVNEALGLGLSSQGAGRLLTAHVEAGRLPLERTRTANLRGYKVLEA